MTRNRSGLSKIHGCKIDTFGIKVLETQYINKNMQIDRMKNGDLTYTGSHNTLHLHCQMDKNMFLKPCTHDRNTTSWSYYNRLSEPGGLSMIHTLESDYTAPASGQMAPV